MKIALRGSSTAALLLACGLAAAQQQMEIIPLRAQTVDRVLPVLMPLLEPGGTLTGMNDQLFLRASAANRADIKRALAAIDVPARRLVIHVATTREALEAGRGAGIGGQVVISEETTRGRIAAGAWDGQTASSQRAGQMVRTVEGGSAFISAGRSLPLPMRQASVGPGGVVVTDSVVFRDVGSGFYATPRLSGDRVTLEISQQAESMSNHPQAPPHRAQDRAGLRRALCRADGAGPCSLRLVLAHTGNGRYVDAEPGGCCRLLRLLRRRPLRDQCAAASAAERRGWRGRPRKALKIRVASARQCGGRQLDPQKRTRLAAGFFAGCAAVRRR